MAGRRFTLAGLLLSITLIGLILAFAVPPWRYRQRARTLVGVVAAIAMSADGSTAAALTGDGMLRIWDVVGGAHQATMATGGGLGRSLALSFDGKLAALPKADLRGGIEIWDTGSKTRKRLLPSVDPYRLSFSPVENLLAVATDGDLILYSLDGEEARRCAVATSWPVAFSPHGLTIAAATDDGIQLFDTASGAGKGKHLADDIIAFDTAFSPDGKTLAAYDGTTLSLISVADLKARASRQFLYFTDVIKTAEIRITYLPGGRAIAVPRGSGVSIVDAVTLEPLRPRENYNQVAAGLRGQHFVVADRGTVDLYDAATLQKVKRLLDANPKPSPVLPLVGLCVWLAIFFNRRMRNQIRACPKCGGRFVPAGKGDANTECPTCREDARLKTLSAEQATGEQRIQSQRNWRNLLLLDVLVAAGAAIGGQDRFGLLPTFVVVLLGLPALVFVAVRLLRKWVILLPSNLPAEIATAERAAGSPGQVRYVGEVLVWSAEGASLADELEPQLEAVRERLAELTGRLISPSPRLRVFFFADGDGVVRFLQELGYRLEVDAARRGIYISAPVYRMFVGEHDVPGQEPDRCSTLRWCIARHLIEQASVPVSCAWLLDGLAGMIAYESSEQERASLNRRALAGIAAGRTIPAAEWLAGTRRRRGNPHLHDYAWLRQFQTQSWSLMEFVCGCGATPERRAAFQQLFHDADLQKRPAEAFERHFGGLLDELFAQCRAWVEEQGVDEHHPPSPDIAEYLTQGPLAKISAPETPRRDRVEAVRAWGERGYAFGTEQVVALLGGDDEELRAEAVYALECVSGLSLGSSAEA